MITLILIFAVVADAAETTTAFEPQGTGGGGGSAAISCPNSTLPVQMETFHTYALMIGCCIAPHDYCDADFRTLNTST